MSTPSPYEYILTTGVVVPDTSALLSDVQTEFQQTFGADLVVTPDTPQGVLITAEALAREEVVNNNAALANQINPNVAGGVFLDAILALFGQARTQQTQTTVVGVVMTGVAGTIIPAGSQAQTAAGDLFALVNQVTLDSGGSATGTFNSVEYGPIPCAENALDQPVTYVLGWETVLNSSEAGVLGNTTQSDQQARATRTNTLAFQAVSLPEAITSALYGVPGVQSLSFLENVSATTQTIDGIVMTSHSVYACVNGGADTDVAAALLENKSSGCGWNGGTTVDVVEPTSGQTYAVQFDRPSQIGILVTVDTPNGNSDQIIQSILDYANGLVQITDQNGVSSILAGFVVGADVSPFDIAGAIMAENPGIFISNLTISLESDVDFTNSPIDIGVNEIAYTQESYITVNVG